VPNLIVSAVSTFDNKGLKKGKKEISAFDKNVQNLGKTFAKVFGSIALANFGKNAVNAFIESEKAAAKLRTTVDNLGLSFEQRAIEDYLKTLSLQFGIVDENLIPGFQRLLIVTKDVAAAQSIFQTALDVSAGTGKDLTSVSTSLSKAYLGDNVALGRLGVGLSKAQLKSSSFLDVQKTLNTNFAGQASAAVAGYAGDMAKLTVAVDESKEAIGKGLLDALKTLSGDTSIDTLTAKMVTFADTLGRYINNIAGFAKVTANIFNVKDPNFFRRQPTTAAPGASTTRVKDYQLTVKTTAARKSELAILTSSNKARTEIDKLKDKFDLERIGLTAALNAATDEETKLRISAQIAILDNNAALAKKINAELEAAKSATNLSDAFGTAANALTLQISKMQSMNDALIDKINAKIAAGAYTPPAGLNIPGVNNPLVNTPSMSPLVNANKIPAGAINPQTIFTDAAIGADLKIPATLAQSEYIMSAMSARLQAQADAYLKNQQEIKLTIDTSATGDRFAQLIAESLQAATKSGLSSTPVGLP
jgi:hypothetical protein